MGRCCGRDACRTARVRARFCGGKEGHILAGYGVDELNIVSYSEDWRSSTLSNFAPTPFTLRCGEGDLRFATVESLWQGIKWPPGSEMRRRVFGMAGIDAKRAGSQVPYPEVLEFCEEKFSPGSREHHALAERAMREKMMQNPVVQRALLATGALRFTHHVLDEQGEPVADSRTLPAAVFCEILSRLRDELRASGQAG